LLSTLRIEARALSLAELAELTSLDKATLLRYLRSLQEFQLARRDDDGYRLGIGAFELGASYVAQLDLHRISRPFMEELAASLTETISLAMLDGSDVVYVEVVRGQAEIGVQSRIGARQQAHCTSLGKALTAWLPQSERARVLYASPLTKLTARTLVKRAEIEHHLAEVREQGFAVDDQERLEGVRCVGAPIRDRTGAVVAAMSISGAAFRMEGHRMDRARGELLRATRAISSLLGASDLANEQPRMEL
jgi:IclR family acetate operon transcriptional repressor